MRGPHSRFGCWGKNQDGNAEEKEGFVKRQPSLLEHYLETQSNKKVKDTLIGEIVTIEGLEIEGRSSNPQAHNIQGLDGNA